MKRRSYLAATSAAVAGTIGASPGIRRTGGSFLESLACSAGYTPDRFEAVSDFEPNAVYAVEEPDDLVLTGDAELDRFVSDTQEAAGTGDVLLARKRRVDVGMPHAYRAYRPADDGYRESARTVSDAYVTEFFPDAPENVVSTPCIERTGPFENGDF